MPALASTLLQWLIFAGLPTLSVVLPFGFIGCIPADPFEYESPHCSMSWVFFLPLLVFLLAPFLGEVDFLFFVLEEVDFLLLQKLNRIRS